MILDGDDRGGAADADGVGGEHIMDRGGLGAKTAGEGTWGGSHDGPVVCCSRRCVDKAVGCGY